MTDQAAILRAIIDEPDDDTHRLVFADWLDDADQGEWAALIRAQCAQQRLLSPWHDPYTDPSLLPLRSLTDRPRDQVRACIAELFTAKDLRDEPGFSPRFRWKLRRGMLEYVEIWGESGVQRFVERAERLFATVPLADLVLRLYPSRDGIVNWGSSSPVDSRTLDRLFQVAPLTRLRNLDLRGISPLGVEPPPRGDSLFAFARIPAATQIWVSPWTGSEATRARLRDILGPRMIESAPHPDNPGDEIPF